MSNDISFCILHVKQHAGLRQIFSRGQCLKPSAMVPLCRSHFVPVGNRRCPSWMEIRCSGRGICSYMACIRMRSQVRMLC